MAKRPHSKPKPQGSQARTSARGPAPRMARANSGTTPPSPPQPARRATYVEAVAIYERAVEATQRHDFNHALALLESVLQRYPEEKELHERVRLYMNICQRHATPRAAAPQTVAERLYAATLAINGGRYDEALA